MKPLNIVFALAGAVVMSFFLDSGIALAVGLLCGYMFGEIVDLRNRVTILESKLSSGAKTRAKPVPFATHIASSESGAPRNGEAEEPLMIDASVQSFASDCVSPQSDSQTVRFALLESSKEKASGDKAEPRKTATDLFKRYLGGSNFLVRVGVVVLFFGLPLLVFGLLRGLVGHVEFGPAVGAVVLAGLYIFTVAILWRSQRNTLRPLIETFLALGVMFATVAVPLAGSGHWVAEIWALEGGALFWVGLCRQRLLPRLAGLMLQIGAALFLLFFFTTAQTITVAGGGLLAVSGFFISYLIERDGSCLHNWEKTLAPVMMGWGLVWWLGTGLHQIDLMVSSTRNAQVVVIFAAGSLALFNRTAVKLNWSLMRYPGLALLPLMLMLSIYAFEHRIKADPFREGWWIVWLFNFAAFYDSLKSNETFWAEGVLKIYHVAGGLLFLFLLTWDAAYWADFTIKTSDAWPFAVWGLVPGLGALVLLNSGERLGWPVRPFRHLYQHRMVAVILLYLMLWCFRVCFEQADPDPLVYLPILNPVDLVILFVFLLILRWNQRFSQEPLVDRWVLPVQLKAAVIGVFGCIWLSAVVIRTVHFWGEIPYNAPALTTSVLVQTSLSVLWSFYAMGILFISTRRGLRDGWIAGAGLLAIVVIKLFFVDLSGSGTIVRIISFVAVGLLLLIVGYFSSLPPNIRKENGL